ncbi:hypothetical protein LCGC14_3054710 [marine sediment metagenome]|uniref:Uncharacterized protein n=1 Tax=marine sediment metagenome TaxID=412755 RepID=A0A0F8X8Z2_9ZZZZ
MNDIVPLTYEQMDTAMRKVGELTAALGELQKDRDFWKRRADQRQIDINELKHNPADPLPPGHEHE